MYRVSRLGELLEVWFRRRFDALVRQHNADKYAKKFSRWDQFVPMACAQLQGPASLRTLTEGLEALSSHHYHLGARAMGRSSLAEANKRDPAVFAAVAQKDDDDYRSRLPSSMLDSLNWLIGNEIYSGQL